MKKTSSELDDIHSTIKQLSTVCNLLIELWKILIALFAAEGYCRALYVSLLSANTFNRAMRDLVAIDNSK